MEIHWKWGWVESQGITKAGRTVLAKLMETQAWHLPAHLGWVRGGLNKVKMASASTFVWEKAAHPALALSQTIQFLPRSPWHFSRCCPSAEAHRE